MPLHPLDRICQDASMRIPGPASDWSFNRSRIARNLRHRRQQLRRKDDLVVLCLGVAVYIAKTGQSFPGIEKEAGVTTSQSIRHLL